MDFCAETNEVSKRKTACREALEQPIECDITLPEYLPDIQRVLKCSLTAHISSVQKTGDRVTADGTGRLSVLYMSDTGKLQCLEQGVPFSRFFENRAVEECECCVRAKTEYVNCRAVSGRRLDIHGSISITFSCYSCERKKLICACRGGGVETKCEKNEVCNMLGCSEKGFTVSEIYEIGDAKPSISQIVRSYASAVIEDTKAVSGKILIKGELTVKTLYIAETNDNELQTTEHTMPINQIVEVEKADDESINIIKLVISDLAVSAKSDAAGALRLLDAGAEIRAYTETYKSEEMSMVTDAYSVNYEIESKLTPTEIRRLDDSFTDTHLCRGRLDLSGTDTERILDMSVAGIEYNTSRVKDELLISGAIKVNLLTVSRENEISFFERQFDFEYRRREEFSGERTEFSPFITVTGSDYILNSGDTLDARVEITIYAAVFSVSMVNVITDITVDSERPKKPSEAALTVYFADKGEKVWDIARHYNTTADKIISENNLEGMLVTEKCRLLIPRA